MEWIIVLQLLICLFTPALMIWASGRLRIDKWLSPVVLCYGFGILLANIHVFNINTEQANNTMGITIFLALPLLLFSTRLSDFFSRSRSVLLSFFLCVFAGVICSVIMAWFFRDHGEDTSVIAGMLVGLYTGGTPNMSTLSLALGARDGLYIIMNSVDILWSGLYLLLLTSVLKLILQYFLVPYREKEADSESELTEIYNSTKGQSIGQKLKNWSIGFALSLIIAALSLGIVWLVTSTVSNMGAIILLLTTLSLLASFIPFVQSIPGTYELGEYLLFVFCVAAGLIADLSELSSTSGIIFMIIGLTMYSTIILHFFLAKFFRIDVDTAIITSTAAIFGPIFIGQVASAIKNKSLVFPGIITGLAGMALGNYLGLLVAWFVNNVF